MPSKQVCFPFSTPSNPKQMILNVHSLHTGFEEVSICQNCGLKMKAKCRWKWLWKAGPNSLSRDYWVTKLAGWGFQTVTGAERCRAEDGVLGVGLFPFSYKSILMHFCLKGAMAAYIQLFNLLFQGDLITGSGQTGLLFPPWWIRSSTISPAQAARWHCDHCCLGHGV